ncbi:hypothetical protein SAMN06297358_0041 [Pedobacter xixiisoli]|uniref:Uncharacterized protein n=1 Tax=Pedobacter xixiisoli TaxID=1476464 RepID=A0A285ZNI1_9SPHI|nr:hypothetical protein SAMN06297358_0041 [Pedobacter xixiisoli]
MIFPFAFIYMTFLPKTNFGRKVFQLKYLINFSTAKVAVVSIRTNINLNRLIETSPCAEILFLA